MDPSNGKRVPPHDRLPGHLWSGPLGTWGKDGRPPWWPEGEPWPPPAEHWRGAGGRFVRRVGCAAFALFLLVSFVGWLFANLGFGSDDRGYGGDGYDGPPGGFVGILVLVLIGAAIFRAVRRTAAPIGDVMEAADRVAAGDYAVRVSNPARGEIGRLVHSFNEMAARLETNETQRRHLLADVTHELRTPLAVIRGNLEGILDGVYPADEAHLGPILDETTTMARLLDDLSTLSLAEAGALRLHREPTAAAALIEDVVAAFAPRAAEAGVSLSGEAAPLPDLDADPVRIRQVLENLVANALRHTPRGGGVRITARLDRRAALFAVADTGTGIAPEMLPRVFDRFAKSADSGGSGLGLAIAKSLVEAHGGAIHADSPPGKGTTVRFTIPLEANGGSEKARGEGAVWV